MNIQKVECVADVLPEISNCHADIPEMGLHYSPMTVVTHSPRFSLFTLYGNASKAVEEVCETGNINPLVDVAQKASNLTKFGMSGAIIDSDEKGTVEVVVTGENSHLTAISMIGPTPDGIGHLANIPMVNAAGHYICDKLTGKLTGKRNA